MKIGVFGASGTGKSKLVEWISNNYKIENVNLSGKALWPELGLHTHEDLIIKSANNPDWGTQYQGDLLAYRLMELDKRDTYSFVSDRTPIDNIVYMLLQSSMYLSDDDTKNFIENAVKHTFKYYTHLIGLPVLRKPPVQDGKRVINFHYQRMVDNVYKHVLENFVWPILHAKNSTDPRFLIMTGWEWNDRIKTTRDFVSPFRI